MARARDGEIRCEKPGHELSDASSNGLMWFAIALIIASAVMHVSLAAWFFRLRGHYFAKSAPAMTSEAMIAERRPPPGPRLQVNPAADLKAYLAKEEHLLASYGWIDPEQRIARIPIDRAMELFAQKRGSP